MTIQVNILNYECACPSSTALKSVFPHFLVSLSHIFVPLRRNFQALFILACAVCGTLVSGRLFRQFLQHGAEHPHRQPVRPFSRIGASLMNDVTPRVPLSLPSFHASLPPAACYPPLFDRKSSFLSPSAELARCQPLLPILPVFPPSLRAKGSAGTVHPQNALFPVRLDIITSHSGFRL